MAYWRSRKTLTINVKSYSYWKWENPTLTGWCMINEAWFMMNGFDFSLSGTKPNLKRKGKRSLKWKVKRSLKWKEKRSLKWKEKESLKRKEREV